jgi:hypothetical protein
MRSSRIVTCYPVGILTKKNLPFRNKTKCRLLLFRFRGRYVQRNSEHCVSFSPEIGFHTILKLPISLNVGTGYYIIAEKDGYSPGTLQLTFTLIFITPFLNKK